MWIYTDIFIDGSTVRLLVESSLRQLNLYPPSLISICQKLYISCHKNVTQNSTIISFFKNFRSALLFILMPLGHVTPQRVEKLRKLMMSSSWLLSPFRLLSRLSTRRGTWSDFNNKFGPCLSFKLLHWSRRSWNSTKQKKHHHRRGTAWALTHSMLYRYYHTSPHQYIFGELIFKFVDL